MNSIQFEIKCLMCGKQQNYKLLPEIQTNTKLVELTCDHSFCLKCFSEHCKQLINQREFSKPQDLKCPRCPKPINIFYLLSTSNELLFEEYNKKCWNSFEIRNEFSDKDCEGNDHCNYDQCCNENECQFEEKKNCNIDLNAELIKKNNIKNCPGCGVLIERTCGCFLMRCESSKCQKKIAFCFLCLEILKADMERAHYPNHDTYKPCSKFLENKK